MRFHDDEAIVIAYKSLSISLHYRDLFIIIEIVNDKCRVKEWVQTIKDLKWKRLDDISDPPGVKKWQKLYHMGGKIEKIV